MQIANWREREREGRGGGGAYGLLHVSRAFLNSGLGRVKASELLSLPPGPNTQLPIILCLPPGGSFFSPSTSQEFCEERVREEELLERK